MFSVMFFMRVIFLEEESVRAGHPADVHAERNSRNSPFSGKFHLHCEVCLAERAKFCDALLVEKHPNPRHAER